MGSSADQILNEASGKAGVIRITVADGEVSASDFGYDAFAWFKQKGSTATTLKALSAAQIKNAAEEVISDFSTTGAYGGSAESLGYGEVMIAPYTKITVATGEVWACLERRTTKLHNDLPE